ncbi:MAG: spore maturation protein CgeB [Lachnospiraceae bacterium]|nr:spore maturation protein CgeB [Lachnospiraceae bacterium]
MKILFYRYGSICEPDIIDSFKKMGIEVLEETSQISNKEMLPSQTVTDVSSILKKHTVLFVFSVNFFPAVSDTCELFRVPYVSWTVDSPVMELFSPALSNKCNRTFLFDRAQYEYFRPKNPEGIFYLPLATNTERWDSVIRSASNATLRHFSADLSFIGSLYETKNPYAKISGLSDYTKGYIDGVIEAQMGIYGYNFIESMLTPAVMEEFFQKVPDLTCSPYADTLSPGYVMANHFIGMELAMRERYRLLGLLSEQFDVSLYTFSDTSSIPKVHAKGGAKTLTEMPLIFHQSKINLNMTIRPIQTGLSLRVYDVLGCGGFLLTNYQAELPEYYEPGKEVETFSSPEELADKADFYLRREDERKKIARLGYEKTKAMHTYDHRIAEMIRIIHGTL